VSLVTGGQFPAAAKSTGNTMPAVRSAFGIAWILRTRYFHWTIAGNRQRVSRDCDHRYVMQLRQRLSVLTEQHPRIVLSDSRPRLSTKTCVSVTEGDYYEVTRDSFTANVTQSILRFVGSSGGGLPGACDLRVGRRFLFLGLPALPTAGFRPPANRQAFAAQPKHCLLMTFSAWV
jgi:hypothetical protein